jgi:hypothetical protein
MNSFVITSLEVRAVIGGAEEDRTPDLLRARQALSQLSYGPRINRQIVQVNMLADPRNFGGSGWT